MVEVEYVVAINGSFVPTVGSTLFCGSVSTVRFHVHPETSRHD